MQLCPFRHTISAITVLLSDSHSLHSFCSQARPAVGVELPLPSVQLPPPFISPIKHPSNVSFSSQRNSPLPLPSPFKFDSMCSSEPGSPGHPVLVLANGLHYHPSLSCAQAHFAGGLRILQLSRLREKVSTELSSISWLLVFVFCLHNFPFLPPYHMLKKIST